MDFDQVLHKVEGILKQNPRLVSKNLVRTEAEILTVLAYEKTSGTKLSRVKFYMEMTSEFPAPAQDLLFHWTEERAKGIPLQHITGVQTFLNHDYVVGPEVLVPRPETELLCVTASQELKRERPDVRLGLEIGVGSGVLSIELLSEFRKLKMIASELTKEAARCAAQNAKKILGEDFHGRITIVPARTYDEVWEPFQRSNPLMLADFLISNPPYLAQNDGIEEEVLEYEPKEALFAPVEDPMFFYRRISEEAEKFLRPLGLVFLELPSERATEIGRLFSLRKWNIKILPDLNGLPRVLVGKLKGGSSWIK